MFSGGFVGVDVFLVISGYLITSILIEAIENKRFSIVHFYERRARRILPALFFVMIVSIPFAWMWMLPLEMKSFSQSLVATSLFTSNILFWRRHGYFDAVAEENPLLHTWSLAIEEQYYALFPIFLIFAWRFGKNRVFYMIILIAGISLLLSEWGSRHDSIANFYLAPTRAWELFAGAAAAFTVQKHGVQKNNLLALLGLAAILFSVFAFDEHTPFPGFYALVPTFGAVLLVLYAEKETFAARLLSTKAFVGIGLISYSAYLWHHPLFAFARIRTFQEPAETFILFLGIMSFSLAYLSWRFIEQPFRSNDRYQRKHILIGTLLGTCFFALFGVIGHITAGFVDRFSGADQHLIGTATSYPLRRACHFPQKLSSLDLDACEYFSGATSIAVLGNSHGAELAYALAKELEPSGKAVVQHTMSGCKHNYRKSDEIQSICYRWHEKIVESLLRDEAIETVVLSYRNDGYIENASYRNSLTKLVESLLSVNKKVVLTLQAPLPGAHINDYLRLSMTEKQTDVLGLPKSEWRTIYSARSQLLKELPKEVLIVDPEELLCSEINCYVIKDNKAYYFDDQHLSIEGAGVIARYILDQVLKSESVVRKSSG